MSLRRLWPKCRRSTTALRCARGKPSELRISVQRGWLLLLVLLAPRGMHAGETWPQWRGPASRAVADTARLPIRWNMNEGLCWQVSLAGEGSSSPIVWHDTIFLTSAEQHGQRRHLHCLDVATGKLRWTRTIEDRAPELTSAVTGHAAATPVTDGQLVIAQFGNAGVVCYDFAGQQQWHRALGEFESELGLASSPVLYEDLVILLCDHDGDKFSSFDSFLVALDKRTGAEQWRTVRSKLYRSWSTPVLVPGRDGRELVINGQDALRGYDPRTGTLLWTWEGMTPWVTPTPVFDGNYLFACSGRQGPIVCLRPGGRGTVTDVVRWKNETGGSYVCSPVVYEGYLYVLDESGILTCYAADSGERTYRERVEGKYFASPIAGAGKLYFSNDAGVTSVVRAGPAFELLASNPLDSAILASPAAVGSRLLIRTEKSLVCIEGVDRQDVNND